MVTSRPVGGNRRTSLLASRRGSRQPDWENSDIGEDPTQHMDRRFPDNGWGERVLGDHGWRYVGRCLVGMGLRVRWPLRWYLGWAGRR